jgi:hypothetical protein
LPFSNPVGASQQPCRREPGDLNTRDDFARDGRDEISPGHDREGGIERAHAPGECERLPPLATLIFRMKDLGDEADSQGLHRLSLATAMTIAGLQRLSALAMPTLRLRQEFNVRNVRSLFAA